MNQTERGVLRSCNEELVRVLDARHIAPLLFTKGYLAEETMEELYEGGSRRNICQKFLLSIVNTCPFDAFLNALCCKKYMLLAQKLKDMKYSKDNKGDIEALKCCQTSSNQFIFDEGCQFENISNQEIENTCTSNLRLNDLKLYTDASVHRMEDLKIPIDADNSTTGEIESYACHKIEDLKDCYVGNSGNLNYELKSYATPSLHIPNYFDENNDRSDHRINYTSRNTVSIANEIPTNSTKAAGYRGESLKIRKGTIDHTLKHFKCYTDTQSEKTEYSSGNINANEDSKHSTDISRHRIQNLKSYADTRDLKLKAMKSSTDTRSYTQKDTTVHANTNDHILEYSKCCTETSLDSLKGTLKSTAHLIEESDQDNSNCDRGFKNLESDRDPQLHKLKAVESLLQTDTASLEYKNMCHNLRTQRLEQLKYYNDANIPMPKHSATNNGTDKHALVKSDASFDTTSQGVDEVRCTLNNSATRLESYIDLRAHKIENLKCNLDNDISKQTVAHSEVSVTNKKNISTLQENVTLPQSVRRIALRDSSHTRKLANLAHKLKTLSHNGNVEKLREIAGSLLERFRNNKSNLDIGVGLKMKEADVAFTVLEAEASAKRVKYDVTLYESDIFKEMQSVIPFTSNPTCSSMTFLTRYGSAVSMLETLDTGIAHLMYAKHHAQHIEPGKSTGMVYYIEVNLLSQKYEQNPVSDLKEKILKTAEEAISHFTHEDEDIRRDYQRMLMLKMAFCHLGIGLFCRLIENVSNSLDDRKAAKSCLDFIERPENWTDMEKRRKMLFMVAKAEIYRQENQFDLARFHATEARKLALEGDWKTELSNIEIFLKSVENPDFHEHGNDDVDIENIINELLGDNDEFAIRL